MILRPAAEANLYALFPFAYILPSIVLYFVALYIINVGKSRKKFSTSFYRLFTMSAINNMLHEVTYYMYMRVTSAPLFTPLLDALPSRHFLLSLLYVMIFSCHYGVYIIDAFISFNRFTVIWLKTTYEQFWRTNLKYVYVIAVVLPISINWYIWACDPAMLLYPADTSRGYSYDLYKKENVPWMVTGRITTIVVGLCASLSLLFNIYVAFHLIKQWHDRKKTNNGRSASWSRHVRLFAYNVLIFLTEVASFFVQFTALVSPDLNVRLEMYKYMLYIADVCALSPIWFLLLTNKEIRNEMMRPFRKRGGKGTTVVISMYPSKTQPTYSRSK